MTDLTSLNQPPCTMCGSGPTVKANIRGHRGIIVVMQFLSQKGHFCRDCGISTFRTMTSRTLVQGWWGYGSFIITPIVLVWNLFQRLKFNKLAAPMPAADGSSRLPLPVGRPLLRRPTAIGLVIPLAVIGVIGYALVFGSSSRVGQCIVGKTGQDVTFVSCDKPNDGKVIAEADDPDACPAEADGYVEQWIERRRGSDTKLDQVLCIQS